MLRKYLIIGLLIGQIVLIAVLVGAFLQRPDAVSASNPTAPDLAPDQAPQAQAAINSYVWSFAAKFVCGQQPPLQQGTAGEPVVKPGNYATDINIHNYNYRSTFLRKKFLVLVENGQTIGAEPLSVQPRRIITMTLGSDMATMDDCNTLWKYIYPTGVPSPRPLTVGYLVILSPLDLDVDVVYTVGAPGDVFATQSSVSIDVERVTGKRVFLPAGILP